MGLLSMLYSLAIIRIALLYSYTNTSTSKGSRINLKHEIPYLTRP